MSVTRPHGLLALSPDYPPDQTFAAARAMRIKCARLTGTIVRDLPDDTLGNRSLVPAGSAS